LLQTINNFHPSNDASKYRIVAIKLRKGLKGDIKLGAG